MKMVEGLVSPMVVGLSRTPKSRGPFLGTPKNPKNTPPPKTPKIGFLAKRGGVQKWSFLGCAVPFFCRSVGIRRLKSWGGSAFFRSILRGVLGPPKTPFFDPLFGGVKKGSKKDPFRPTPQQQIPNQDRVVPCTTAPGSSGTQPKFA